METRAIVTEYNPLHKGHVWQIQQVRQSLGPNGCIITVMSGDHVQRGGPAVLSKWARTSLALSQGVDLVLELPAVFATQSAQYFADGAVRLIQATGICRDQVSGAGYPDSVWYDLVPQILNEEPLLFRQTLRESLEEGQSFAAARSRALQAVFMDTATPQHELDLQTFLREPNDNLNLAYRSAALRYAPKMRLHRLPRVDGSATAVREALSDLSRPGGVYKLTDILQVTSGLIPAETAAVLSEAGQHGRILLEADCFPAIATMLRSRTEADLDQFPGMSEGMAQRLKNIIASNGMGSSSMSALLAEANSKRFPTARVRRALFSALLGITQDDLDNAQEAGPQAIRVLGFSKKGRHALKLMRRYATVPVVTKASDYLEYSEAEHPHLRRQAELDMQSSDIRSFLSGGVGGEDFAQTVLMR